MGPVSSINKINRFFFACALFYSRSSSACTSRQPRARILFALVLRAARCASGHRSSSNTPTRFARVPALQLAVKLSANSLLAGFIADKNSQVKGVGVWVLIEIQAAQLSCKEPAGDLLAVRHLFWSCLPGTFRRESFAPVSVSGRGG